MMVPLSLGSTLPRAMLTQRARYTSVCSLNRTNVRCPTHFIPLPPPHQQQPRSSFIVDGDDHSVPDLLAPSPLIFLFHTRIRRGTDPIFDGPSAGMMTTDAAKGDALWWWFLPALVESASGFDAVTDMPPTLIWLQGGPGAPSTYGELGPGPGLGLVAA